jgi:hypothetical protein
MPGQQREFLVIVEDRRARLGLSLAKAEALGHLLVQA